MVVAAWAATGRALARAAYLFRIGIFGVGFDFSRFRLLRRYLFFTSQLLELLSRDLPSDTHRYKLGH